MPELARSLVSHLRRFVGDRRRACCACPRRLLQHHMRVDAAEPERVDRRPAHRVSGGRLPGGRLLQRAETGGREGRVRVELLDQLGKPVVADAGHVVMTKGGETLVIEKSGSDIADDLSWRGGVLVFNQQTLAEAAEQFNRYNERQILVEGPARRIRIGGSFKADNVDVFVLLLHRGFGLSVNEQGGTIVVSR